MATTTNRYLSYPAAAAGISRASSGTGWTVSSYTEVVPASTIAATFYIAGVTWMWWTPLAAVDTTYEVTIEIATGGAGAETMQIQIPASVRMDTAVGYVPSQMVILPEPVQVAANTRVAVRINYGVSASVTVTAIKILYQTA
jgi:hypothetical protein